MGSVTLVWPPSSPLVDVVFFNTQVIRKCYIIMYYTDTIIIFKQTNVHNNSIGSFTGLET